jgi:hypothetical protein
MAYDLTGKNADQQDQIVYRRAREIAASNRIVILVHAKRLDSPKRTECNHESAQEKSAVHDGHQRFRWIHPPSTVDHARHPPSGKDGGGDGDRGFKSTWIVGGVFGIFVVTFSSMPFLSGEGGTPPTSSMIHSSEWASPLSSQVQGVISYQVNSRNGSG